MYGREDILISQPSRCSMIFSDNVSQLAQALQDAGDSDAQLRHSSELIQQLKCPLVAEPLQAQADSASSVVPEVGVSDKATSVVTEEAPLALSEYGDALHIPMMWVTRIWSVLIEMFKLSGGDYN